MTHYSIGFLILVSCCLLEALPRPTNNEETTTASIDLVTETEANLFMNKERSLMYEEDTGSEDSTREIVEKIRAINDAVIRPHKRQQINWNIQPQSGGGAGGGYNMDKAVLEKLQQIIAAGKLHSYPDGLVSQDNNMIPDYADYRQSRDLPFAHRSMVPIPYLTSMPVLVMPVPSMNSLNNDISPQQFGQHLTRQESQFPSSFFSQFQWPFAQFFPILIRDPLLSIMNGGGWSSFIESGQSADICRKQKSSNEEIQKNMIDDELKTKIIQAAVNKVRSRQGRAIKKRTVSHETNAQNIDKSKKVKKIFPIKPFQTTPKPAKQTVNTKKDTEDDEDGDLRFGQFSLFGNKKPVVPSPGFFINKLKVRRGGVAIAGPGGVATAGRGGTAIVGPGGLAYTQPGGLAVAGPAAKIFALAPDADLSSIVSRLQEQNGSVPRSLQAIPEGKLVAIGPIIYYHPNQ